MVRGIYASRAEAETVRSHLLAHGLPAERVDVVERVRADDNNRQLAAADGVLKDVLIDATIGAVVGTVIGALAQVAVVVADFSLLTARFVAPLAMIGWGTALGAIVGGAHGATGARKQGTLADIVTHAIRRKHVTLLAHTRTDEEARLASSLIGASAVQGGEQRSAS